MKTETMDRGERPIGRLPAFVIGVLTLLMCGAEIAASLAPTKSPADGAMHPVAATAPDLAQVPDLATARVPDAAASSAPSAGASVTVGTGAIGVAAAELPVRTRALRFEDSDDGGVVVVDADSGDTVERLAPGTNGFLRALMRGLARERLRLGAGPQTPFLLSRSAEGRVRLEDPVTRRDVELNAFGPTNAGVFVRLLRDTHPARAGI